MKEKLILIGGGGHCRSCIAVIEKNEDFVISGIVDVQNNLGKEISGYKVIGTDSDLPQLIQEYRNCLVTIGQIKCVQTRKRIFNTLMEHNAHLPAIVSQDAIVDECVDISAGTIILTGAIVNRGVKIGKNCIINTGAIIEHGTQISDHCHIAVGAVVCGDCQIGEGSLVGSNATVVQSVQVPANCIIGAGAIVRKSLTEPGTYVGNPPKEIP